MISTIRKVLYLLQAGDRLKLFILFLMMLFGALLEIIGVGMIPVFVSIVATPEKVLNVELLIPVWEFFGIENSGDLLIYGSLLLILIFILKNSYLVLYEYIKSRFIYLRFASIGSNLFKYYMYAPYDFHLSRNTSELLRNATQETVILANHIILPLLKIAMDFVLIAGIFAFLLFMEPLNTLIVFVILGGGGALFARFLREKIREYGRTAQIDRDYMIRAVNEGLGGFKDARVLNRESWFFRKFATRIRRYSKSLIFNQVASSSNKPVIEIIAISGLLLISIILYLQGRGLENVIPILTLFGAATIRLMPAIQEMMKAVTSLKYYCFSVDPIYNDIKALKMEARKYEGHKSSKLAPGKEKLVFANQIMFDSINYSYPNSEVEAVRNITLSIKKGSAVGFVGASGAGKTTLMDLLLGLLEPQHGRILVDSTDIHSNIFAWRENLGYIPQFIFLSDDTIRANIAFGVPESVIDNEKLNNALYASQLHELIESLPQGIATIIGERGTRLSGGQRQRIGIARALYNNPQVLIMDEGTSALDNITERYVINAIERLKGERTVIMIAHRLTTVQNCDQLFFMQKGEIIDSGTYDELIRKNSEFKKMALMAD
jgi:ATP-binding cassette, subfamily B, bacterial PglK